MDFTGFGWIVFWVFAVGAAAAAFTWTRAMKKRSGRGPRLYMEGLRALVEGDDHVAFERLKATINEDSDNIDAYIKLGDLLRRRGRLDSATRIHEDLTLRLGLPPADVIAIQKSLALDHIAAGNVNEAESSLRKILELDKHSAWAHDQLVTVFLKAGKFEEAFEARRSGARRANEKPGQALALYKTLAGHKLATEGKGHDARLFYKEALNHDEDCLPAMLYIGDAYQQDGRLDDAVEWWTRFANANPKTAYIVFDRLERGYFELGQYGGITRFYERILDADPANTDALIALADLSVKKGDHDEAVRQCRQALDNDPDNIPARAGLIRSFVQHKDLKQASVEIDAMLESAHFHPTGYVCTQCGHTEPEPAWYCPKCKAVGSFGV
ncbi:MAG TPA: tetratricopeptide repeat protein [Acidobacteriota bacterium]|nr:tetratricopeptide repeat protein [Acidobacteriota bacterium]